MSENSIDLPFKETRVGEHLYRCSNLLLTQWIELESMVIRLLGAQILDLDETKLEAYALRVLASASAQDHEKIFSLMGYVLTVQKDGANHMLSRENQEKWWAVYRDEMPVVLMLFFEVQFKDFFSGLGRLLPEVKKQPGKPGKKKMASKRKRSPNT